MEYNYKTGVVLKPGHTSQFHRRLTRRSRVRCATIFTPQDPDATPEDHFPLQTVARTLRNPQPRFINRFNSREILIVVDGSCLNSHSKDQVARPTIGGCSFTFKGSGRTGASTAFPTSDGSNIIDAGSIGFRLEKCGPLGEPRDATSNRAKLRAVIAALEFRDWHAEGWRRLVIATYLEYVVYGATRWLPLWVRRRWRTSGGRKKVANRDLWEELVGVIESLRRAGTETSFWLVEPWNAAKLDSMLLWEAKNTARAAASEADPLGEEFTRIGMVLL
ncbi:hypothetical protein F4778DRAFT_774474 [Xylariomycetidae sp. FL2044]|nr:hypothetical protein F4778DRAFT_774474 [Xylariomycetidae sp. FL2044]